MSIGKVAGKISRAWFTHVEIICSAFYETAFIWHEKKI
jgi:hypothetical protein